MTGGRPFRFLAAILGLWIGGRVVLLWPMVDRIATVVEAIVPPVAALAIAPDRAVAPVSGGGRDGGPVRRTARRSTGAVSPMPVVRSPVLAERRDIQPSPPEPLPPMLLPERPLAHAAAPTRWSASGWLILRGGAPLANAAQLGGSQAGGRIGYALDSGRRVALSVRAMAPLQGRGTEVAAGLDWQPTAAPVHLLVEKRIAVDGGRNGVSLTLVGGLDPTRIMGDWRIEGYGQAGLIAREGSAAEGFGDGAARLSRPVMEAGATRLDLGLGAWGGVQRGAGRLDLGPGIALVVPVGERRLRLTFDWRQRVAGAAAPGSGPALSVGTDF